jgi:hypothetical protein
VLIDLDNSFTLNKIECSKQPLGLDNLAWNNRTGLCPNMLVFRDAVMIKRDKRGHSYCYVRGEILGS